MMHEKTEVLTPTESRQASPRRSNFRVLVVSMLLVIAIAAILYYAIYAYPKSEIGVPDVPEEPAATTETAPVNP